MIRNKKWHNGFGAKIIAAAVSGAMLLSSFSVNLPGGLAYAENADEASSADTVDPAAVSGEAGAEGGVGSSEDSSSNASSEEKQDDSSNGELSNGASSDGESENKDAANEGSEASADADTIKDGSDSKKADSEGEAATGDKTDAADEKSTVDPKELEAKASASATEGSTFVVDDSEESNNERNFDYDKTDVWDFGAENLGDAYNNRLDVDTINGFYSVAPGTTNVCIGSFSVDNGDFVFEDGGNSNTHKIRTTNASLTHNDDKSLKDADGNIYSGYLYSNKSANPNVYVALQCEPDDIITAYVSRNNGDSNIYFENLSDSSDRALHVHTLSSSEASKAVFYPTASAMYKLYSENEKLVVARIYRQHAKYSTLSGSVEGYNGKDSFEIVFKNQKNGLTVSAPVTNGEYSVTLAQGFDYDMSLVGADEYVITSDKTVNIKGDESKNVTISQVSLVTVKGKVTLTYGDEAEVYKEFIKSLRDNLKLVFTPDDKNSVYVPKFEVAEDGTFEATVQSGVNYTLTAEGFDDYELRTTTMKADKDEDDQVIDFIMKVVLSLYPNVEADGLTMADLADTEFTFILLDKENEYKDTTYSYTFSGQQFIDEEASLRVGQYRIEAKGEPEGYKFDEVHSYDVIVEEGKMETEVDVVLPFVSTKAPEKVPYSETVTVGAGKDYETINGALEAIRNMDRTSDQRVTVEITPGNYQEMIVIDTPNVTFRNAVKGGSIVTTDKGVGIASDSVRITGYYGHGYTYYSMGSDCKYDAKLLDVNKHNGYASFKNPGAGTTSGSYWNATVVVNAAGFEAYDIIFENSFNQYQSELAAKDVIEKQSGAKEGDVARASMAAGDVTVQGKKYVERAAAVAVRKAAEKTYFNHCALIGHQDTLYGDTGSQEAYYNCDIYGGTDYICGGMTAVFAKCNLIFNTSDDNGDYGYITAAQHKSADTRGYLMYNCKVTSTTPGVNTAATFESKPGYFGRVWQAGTAEVVYYYTVIDATCYEYKDSSASLIYPIAWQDTLNNARTDRNVEFGTYEMAEGVDNTSARADWSKASDEAKTKDGKDISVATFLGNWDPFAANGDDMDIVVPDEKIVVTKPESEKTETSVFTLESKDITAFKQGERKVGDSEKAGTEDFFTLLYSEKTKIDGTPKTWSDDYTAPYRINFGGKAVVTDGQVTANAIKFTVDNSATVKVWWVANKANYQMALLNTAGATVTKTEGDTTANATYISTLKVEEAGTYYLAGADVNNYIFKVEVTVDKTAEPVVSVLDAKDIDVFAAGAKADGDSVKAGTDNYFTILYSVKSKVEAKVVEFEDGYKSVNRLNFGGGATTEKNAVMFKTSEDNATLKLWWASNAKPVVIYDAQGKTVYKFGEDATKNASYINTVTLEKAGTYFLGSEGGTNYFFRVEVTEGVQQEVVRADWDLVDEPVVKSVALNATDAGKIDFTVSALIGKDGGDKLTAYMLDENRNILDTKSSIAEKEEFTFTFAPSASGKYMFAASLSREDADYTLESSESDLFEFSLPLTAPQFKNAVNKGSGKVTVKFYSVAEAEEYKLVAKDITEEGDIQKATFVPTEVVDNTKTEYEYSFTGLLVGHKYEISAIATRGNDESKAGTIEAEVKADGEREWTFAAFGSGVSSSKSTNGSTVNKDGSVTVWSTGNKGKIVPASTDGLSFYYTAVPTNMNFTFTATATIDSWAFTNGQEGFGLMAADRVGVNGEAKEFWNNSYMASGTKVEYYYDASTGKSYTKDTPGATKITMKLGLGAQEKIGVTKDNLAKLEANDTATVNSDFSSLMYPLETATASKGAGTYNIFGNETSGTVQGTVENTITTVRLRIQKNNTGYFVSYLDENDNVLTTRKFYEPDALSKLDDKNVYIGFFASRTFKATFSDVEIVLTNPEDDAPAEVQDIEYVTPDYKIVSATYSNTAKYELTYVGNADGILTIKDEAGKVLVDSKAVKENESESVITTLSRGDNKFKITFTPNEGFNPEGKAYKLLSSYETKEFSHSVKFATINNDEKVYVSVNGKANAEGTKESPVDIYTAVKYVQPGQTIVLEAGTYNLSSTVKVERGIDGTPSKPIKMVTEGGRAIFDFGKKCAGFIFAGDYWYVNGIDCTKSGNSLKGIQVSGSHITLEDIRTYENGNTGIQISRYLSTDGVDLWPSYDLILNCTSFSNADAGYEDADGFAAKLTCGEGIVFDGCIAYNNADDGWDLFAKVETGSIGQVTIQNCVAFSNGYGVDGTNEGNGNGFKMGGSSMPGAHKLINSIAWNNKAKGIDSNSGPDIQVYNSMSFNNGAQNVALYTNTAANTNYYVDGILSYRTENKSTNENIKNKGTQDTSKIYGALNFFWDDKKSANKDGLTVSDDWFVSLDAPKANANDPYAVAAAMRAEDGSIDLGDFFKLSETGLKALEKAGIEYTDVVSVLTGNYTKITDERDINGSADDAKKDLESESDAGNTGSTEDAGNTGSTENAGNTGSTESPSEAGSTGGTGSSSSNDSASTGSGSSESTSSQDTGDYSSSTASSSASTAASTATSVAASASSSVANTDFPEVAGVTRNTKKNSTSSTKTEKTATENASESSSETKSEAATEATSEAATEAVAEASTEASTVEEPKAEEQTTATITEEDTAKAATPAQEKNFPVGPVAGGAAAVVLVAGVAYAVKTGLMAKLLSFLHIIK